MSDFGPGQRRAFFAGIPCPLQIEWGRTLGHGLSCTIVFMWAMHTSCMLVLRSEAQRLLYKTVPQQDGSSIFVARLPSPEGILPGQVQVQIGTTMRFVIPLSGGDSHLAAVSSRKRGMLQGCSGCSSCCVQPHQGIAHLFDGALATGLEIQLCEEPRSPNSSSVSVGRTAVSGTDSHCT